MGNFWTDLARHLADYERGELEAEAQQFAAEHPDRPDLDPEDRDLIPENDIAPEHHDLRRTA